MPYTLYNSRMTGFKKPVCMIKRFASLFLSIADHLRFSNSIKSAHARYTVFQMAEVTVPRDLFRHVLEIIDSLRPRRMARC
jgi:hypothetical protein